MSTTPTANITKSSPAPSRHHAYDARSPPQSLDLPSHNFPHPHLPPPQDVSSSCQSKRQRTSWHANMAAERASSSSDASSQSGMADNETEAEHSPPQITAPPKKKRTRTLTTPHQSAVLHALLAKSRFPTTAMREDVGRQIGLSARKVQIWFQNQRQKARRPQGESAPLTRPPQFGPFPIITPAGPSSSSYPSPSTGGPASEVSHSGASSARSRGSLDSNAPLSGPGVPGWPSSSHQRGHSSPEARDPPRRAPTSPDIPLAHPQHPLPPRSSQGISPPSSRSSTHVFAPPPHAQATHVETSPHFSRVLPPINLGALEPRTHAEPRVSATSSIPPRTFVNTVLRPDSSARPAGEPSGAIPPPFALQPQPQWDPHTFAPFTRPEFASWSHTPGSSQSSARSSFSAVGADRVSPRARHFSPSPSSGGGRSQLDPPLHHHIISPSRGQRHSASAPSHASVPGTGHARSDDDVGEA